MSFYVGVWLAGIIYTLIKGRLMQTVAANFLDFDLLTIVTAYLLMGYGHTACSAFAFGQGVFIDVLSGGPQGFFTSIYLAVFWALYFGSRFFDLNQPRGQMILIGIVMILKEILFVAMLDLFLPRLIMSKSFGLLILGSAVVTALSAPLFFGFFNYLLACPGEDRSG